MFFASHETSFSVPYDCCTMVAHRVLDMTPGHASHAPECMRCNDSPGDLRGFGSSSTISSATMYREWTPISMLMGHISRCSFSHEFSRLHDRMNFMPEAGSVEGRDFHSNVRRIMCGSSRDFHVDIVLLDFAPPRILAIGCGHHVRSLVRTRIIVFRL
jgi:hypothetical protein